MGDIDPLFALFAAIVALSAGLTLIAVRGGASVGTRTGAVALFALLTVVGYGALIELMSRPKPASLGWVRTHATTVKVAASQLRENEAIYLWLVFDEEPEPRAYKLPWSMEMARQLRDAERRAAQRQSEVRMKTPFAKNDAKTEQVFHAPPRPAPPPKRPDAG
jgi:hypothetical protein